jgi:DNA-binding PadR family transcriptional regulator
MWRYSRDVDRFLPLTPATYYLLISLAEGEKHGYAILRDVAARTEGRITLNVGTLYAALRRLERDGLIAESDERPDPSLDDERRRYYALTPLGRRALAAEAARMEDAVGMARAARLLRRPRPA